MTPTQPISVQANRHHYHHTECQPPYPKGEQPLSRWAIGISLATGSSPDSTSSRTPHEADCSLRGSLPCSLSPNSIFTDGKTETQRTGVTLSRSQWFRGRTLFNTNSLGVKEGISSGIYKGCLFSAIFQCFIQKRKFKWFTQYTYLKLGQNSH